MLAREQQAIVQDRHNAADLGELIERIRRH